MHGGTDCAGVHCKNVVQLVAYRWVQRCEFVMMRIKCGVQWLNLVQALRIRSMVP